MRYMITLQLTPDESSWEHVKEMLASESVELDEDYGLILISKKRQLYTVRATGEVDPETVMARQPKVRGVFPEVKISTT